MLNVSIKDHTEIILFSIVVKIVALQRLGVPGLRCFSPLHVYYSVCPYENNQRCAEPPSPGNVIKAWAPQRYALIPSSESSNTLEPRCMPLRPLIMLLHKLYTHPERKRRRAWAKRRSKPWSPSSFLVTRSVASSRREPLDGAASAWKLSEARLPSGRRWAGMVQWLPFPRLHPRDSDKWPGPLLSCAWRARPPLAICPRPTPVLPPQEPPQHTTQAGTRVRPGLSAFCACSFLKTNYDFISKWKLLIKNGICCYKPYRELVSIIFWH